MIDAHLPILQVILPLLGAVLCVLSRTPLAACGIQWLILISNFVVALKLFLLTPPEGLDYVLGGWAPPLGIHYTLDPLNSALLLLVSGVALAVAPAAARLLAAEAMPPTRIPLYYACLLLNLSGLLGVIITGDIFNMFVFIEIASLSSYVLVALGPGRGAAPAAFRYLVTGTLGATFFLIGIAYLYAITGTLNLADLARLLPESGAPRTVVMAFVFLTLGCAAKFALFPMHAWLPAVYRQAPAAIVAFLAATAGKVYLYAWLRIAYGLFRDTDLHAALLQVLGGVASIAMLLGALLALRQRELRGLLAYSSISNIGYIMLGLSLGTFLGVTAGLLHLLHHALVKGALFMAAAGFLQGAGGCGFKQLRGAARDMPWSFATTLVALLALFGFPFSSGFLSKYFLLLALMERGAWLMVAVVVAASLLGATYCWKLLRCLLERVPEESTGKVATPRRHDPPWETLLACWLLLAPALLIGLFGARSFAWAQNAAALFFYP